MLRFARQCGYRLAPDEVSYPDHVQAGAAFTLHHSWINGGVGVLPNLNKHWASKYRPAWALLDATTNKVVGEATIEKNAEPGEWIKGKSYPFDTSFTVPAGAPAGSYKVACAILNTAKDGMPDLHLALKGEHVGPWHVVGTVNVAGP